MKVFIREAKRTRYNPEAGFETKTEWMLDTEGVNLLEVMCHEEVDYRRVQSNHLCEVRSTLRPCPQTSDYATLQRKW